MTAWKAANLNVLEDIREVDGLFKLAFVEDPWGTKIEVVEDHEDLGFHHLHLRSPDPEQTLAWYQNIFGGEFDQMKGRLDGVRYGRVWLLVSQPREGSLALREVAPSTIWDGALRILMPQPRRFGARVSSFRWTRDPSRTSSVRT